MPVFEPIYLGMIGRSFLAVGTTVICFTLDSVAYWIALCWPQMAEFAAIKLRLALVGLSSLAALLC